MQYLQPINYASSNYYVKYARKHHVVCPPNPQFINNVANADDQQLNRIAARMASWGEGRKHIIPAIINSPYTGWLKNPKALLKRQTKFKSILQTLKTLRGYYLEQHAFYNKQVGDVKAKKSLYQYVSGAIAANRRKTIENNELYLEKTEIYMHGPSGVHKFALADVAPTAADKKAEIWTDMLLIQRMADEQGMEQVLLTETALPQYHSNPTKGRCSYNGASSRQALKWIQDNVHRVIYKRAKAAGINLMGFAVPEPHKDGCPHIHVALFVPPNKLNRFISIVNDVRAEISDEHGINYSLDLRLKTDLENEQEPAQAASYVMKYVIKSFDDPEIGAWYSRDCGGEIRRCNRIGLKGFKSKFNYLYKMRKQLIKHPIKLLRELGEMLCSDMQLSAKKYAFFNHFNPYLKGVYIEDENGNKRFSHVTYIHNGDEVVIINLNRILDPNNKDDQELINKHENGEKQAETTVNTGAEGKQEPDGLTINVCYSRCAGASPDTLKYIEIDEIIDFLDGDDEVINLLDI
jgi:hypothetical protein